MPTFSLQQLAAMRSAWSQLATDAITQARAGSTIGSDLAYAMPFDPNTEAPTGFGTQAGFRFQEWRDFWVSDKLTWVVADVLTWHGTDFVVALPNAKAAEQHVIAWRFLWNATVNVVRHNMSTDTATTVIAGMPCIIDTTEKYQRPQGAPIESSVMDAVLYCARDSRIVQGLWAVLPSGVTYQFKTIDDVFDMGLYYRCGMEIVEA